jgi:hypothetical protein
MILVVHPGSWFFTHPESLIQGSKGHRIPDPDPQKWKTMSLDLSDDSMTAPQCFCIVKVRAEYWAHAGYSRSARLGSWQEGAGEAFALLQLSRYSGMYNLRFSKLIVFPPEILHKFIAKLYRTATGTYNKRKAFEIGRYCWAGAES